MLIFTTAGEFRATIALMSGKAAPATETTGAAGTVALSVDCVLIVEPVAALASQEAPPLLIE